MLLRDKVAIVTGATSGIGRETAVAFAKEGALLAIVGRNETALQEFAPILKGKGSTVLIIKADVTKQDAAKQIVQQTTEQFGQIDILVNAAGIIGSGSAESTTDDQWSLMMQTNVDSVFRLSREAIPYLRKTSGCIVNVSSVAGTRSFPNLLAYCVSKAAIDQLTRCTALDVASDGVRVNAVNPGVVITNLHRNGGMDEASYQNFLERSKQTHPLGRPGTAEEVADSILFLASPMSNWITGVTLNVDGGRALTCAR